MEYTYKMTKTALLFTLKISSVNFARFLHSFHSQHSLCCNSSKSDVKHGEVLIKIRQNVSLGRINGQNEQNNGFC